MSGKKTRQLRAPGLAWEQPQSSETVNQTGKRSGCELPRGASFPCQQEYEYNVMAGYGKSQAISLHQLLSRELYSSFGAQLAPAKVDGLGGRQAWTLTLRVLQPSSGTVTAVRSILSSMNFEETLASAISYDGSIVTRSMWRSKVHRLPLPHTQSGSQATFAQQRGTQTSMDRQ